MTPEKWSRYSPRDQVLNVVAELHRYGSFTRDTMPEAATESLLRCTELIDFMKTDPRWKTSLRELCRSKEWLISGLEEPQSLSEIYATEQLFLQFNAEAFNLLTSEN